MNVKITEQDGEYTATFLVNKNEVGKFKWNTKNSEGLNLDTSTTMTFSEVLDCVYNAGKNDHGIFVENSCSNKDVKDEQ